MKDLPFNSVIVPFSLRHGTAVDLPVYSYFYGQSRRLSSRKIHLDRKLRSRIDSAGRDLRHYGGLSASMILSNHLGFEQYLRTGEIIRRLMNQHPWLTILDVRRSLSRLSHVEFLTDGLLASGFHSKIFRHLGYPTTARLFSDDSLPSPLVLYSSILPDNVVDISLDDPMSPKIVVVRRLKSYPFLCKALYIQENDGRKILEIIDGLKSEGYKLSPVAIRLARELRGSSVAKRKPAKSI